MISLFKKISNISKHATQGGFTLIETMVAILILTTVLAVTMSNIQQSLQASNFARDQITAFYLAEEAMEHIRGIRDTNFKRATGWLTNMETACVGAPGSPKTCRVNPNVGTASTNDYAGGVTACNPAQSAADNSGTGNCYLWYHDNGIKGYYDHVSAGSTSARYKRYVTMEKIGAGNSEIKVTVTVTWNSGRFSPQTYTLTSALYNITQ
jgi:prepilin-type N-terminal cleavage/methylation domain-containing protein